MVSRDDLVDALAKISELIYDKSGVHILESFDIVEQAKVATALGRLLNEEQEKAGDDVLMVFLALSKTMNMLEYLVKAGEATGAMSMQTVIDQMYEQSGKYIVDAGLMTEHEVRKNSVLLCKEALPVLKDFGALTEKKGVFTLTTAGKAAAQIWLTYVEEEQENSSSQE